MNNTQSAKTKLFNAIGVLAVGAIFGAMFVYGWSC